MLQAFVILAAVTTVLACPQHDYNTRATDGLVKRADAPSGWTYAASNTWGVAGESEYLNQILVHDDH